MTQPGSGPQPDLALNPESLVAAVGLFLTPIIDEDLVPVSQGFTAAHAEVAAAHDSEAAGWFGGEGNGEVRPASSSFFNEVEYQLRWLAADYADITQSLQDYRTFLLEYATGVRETENNNTQRLQAIASQLDEWGR